MIAPGLEEETDRLFATVRRLRFLVAQDPLCGRREWEHAVAAVTEEMDVLRNAMRRDLSKTFKYATKTILPSNQRAEIALRTTETGTEENTMPTSDG